MNDSSNARANHSLDSDEQTARNPESGGWSERVEDPNEIVPALQRARKVTDDGKAALLEFITSREINYSRMR
jgi:hypothetical protein